MTYRSLLLALAATLFATTALAAPVVMLQFGSFETKDEAQSHLAELKTKHADTVGSLSTSIREVTLPPDNLTVYRTQAGPVDTREAAQSICGKLTAKGEHCYVVETAMVASAASPAPAPAAVPVAPPVPAPAAASAALTPITLTPPAATPVASTAPPAALHKEAAPLVVSAEEAAQPTIRDAENKAVIEGVSTGTSSVGFSPMPPITAAPPALPIADPRPMDMALDDAAARQAGGTPAAAAPAPAPAAAAPEKKERSFWSRLNPFSGDEEETKPAPTPAPALPVADTAQAVPVERVTAGAAAPMPPTPFVVDPTVPPPPRDLPWQQETPAAPAMAALPESAPHVPAEPPAPALPSPALVAAPEPQAPAPALPELSAVTGQPPVAAPTPSAPVQVMAVPMPAATSSIPLPPPPAPLRAQDREALAAGQIPVSAPPVARPQSTGELPPAAPVAAPMAVQPVPLAAAPAPAVSEPAPFHSGPSALPGGGEARSPAPVSVPQPVPTADMPMAAPAETILQPSNTVGIKTLWAQIGEFADEQEALAFWDAYRHAHPDFPVVRVRVTSPYQLAQRREKAVSLRVGPFSRVESIRNLCGTMPVKRLRCGSVTDLGVSADPNGASGLSGSRYQH